MIAECLEPKGLAPNTPAFCDDYKAVRRRDARMGSRKLRNAILTLQGITPPDEPKERAVTFKSVPSGLCPTCLAPIPLKRKMIAEIQQAVSTYYGIHINNMLGEIRRRSVAHPRQVAMLLASELSGHSIAEIGRRFNKDHTTVLYAIRAVNERAQNDENTAFEVALLRERLRG